MFTTSKMILIAAALIATTGLARATSENDHGVSIYLPNHTGAGVDAYAKQVPGRALRGSFGAEEKAMFDRASRLD